MTPLEPLDTAPLFRPLLSELVALLRSLSDADWERPTLARAWRVRDIAAHLLDGDFRKIAVYRDGHVLPVGNPIDSDRALARFINELNASGVGYAARLSPRLIVDLLEVTGQWVAGIVDGLARDAASIFPVSWAGERESTNWMDTGREYTERWHHQMQIREAVSRPRLLTPRWMLPLIDMSVRALPHAYIQVYAREGTTITLDVHGETAGAWSIVRTGDDWTVMRGRPEAPAAVASMAADDVWRMFYNSFTPQELTERVRIVGDGALVAPLLRTRSVVV